MDPLTAAACSSETRAFCARDADLLALLQSVAGNDERVQQRQQRIRACLVDHADELSPPCVTALVGNVAPTAATEDLPSSADTATHQADVPEAVEALPSDTPVVHPVIVTIVPQHISHDIPPPPPSATDVMPLDQQPQPQPQYVQTTTGDLETGIEVRIMLIHHEGHAIAAAQPQPLPAAAPSYIRIGGDAATKSGDLTEATSTAAATGMGMDMGMSPWLWVVVLPFMCIGMYVSVVQTLAFVRRRRDVVYRVGASQYMPIPTSLSSSKPLRPTSSS